MISPNDPSFASPDPVRIFFSYSQKDEKLRDALADHLSLLVRQGLIETWHDRCITPGSQWAGEIDQHLREAQIILLLVSASFLASDYCNDREVKVAIERHDAGEALVIPIILRPCDWKSAPFGKFQGLPKNGKPVTSWKLRDDAFTDIANGIRTRVEGWQRKPTRRPGPITNVRLRRNPFFTGRDDILTRLHEAFRAKRIPTSIQILSGLGGYGKSQTAAEYVYRYSSEYKAAFWIRADTEAELYGDFLAIAKLLRLVAVDVANPKAAVDLVLESLANTPAWLVIFDNADDPALLRNLIPAGASGDILITSRASEFDILGVAEPVEMPTLSPWESVDLLFLRTKFDQSNREEQEAAVALAGELGHLPLALEQAAACIAALKTTIGDYLMTYGVRRLELLEEFPPVAGDYTRSVATTWSVNFREVEKSSRAAADLLRVCSCLTPDNIPLELLSRGASRLGPEIQASLEGSGGDRLALPRLLRPLRRYSLIHLERRSNAVSIHRLVQDVVQAAMDPATRQVWIERTADALIQVFPMEHLSPAETVIHISRGLERLGTLPPGGERNHRELCLLSILGPSLIATSGYASSKVGEAYQAAATLCRKLGRPPVTFQVTWGLWAFHYVRADLATAKQLAEELLRDAAAGPDPDLGQSLEASRAMASTLFTMGNLTGAQACFRKGTEIYNPQVHSRHGQSYAADPGIVCRSYLCVADLLVDGELAGLRECRRLGQLARKQRYPFSRVYASFWAACFHQLRRDVPKAKRMADQGAELCAYHHFRQWGAMNRIVSGWCVAQQGDPNQAVCIVVDALKEHQYTGAQTLRPYFLLLLAECQLMAGSIRAALETADKALKCADEHGEHTWTAEILRVKGEILLLEAPAAAKQPEGLFRTAIDAAARQSARSLALRAWASLARLLHRSGRQQEFDQVMRHRLMPVSHYLLKCDLRAYQDHLAALAPP